MHLFHYNSRELSIGKITLPAMKTGIDLEALRMLGDISPIFYFFVSVANNVCVLIFMFELTHVRPILISKKLSLKIHVWIGLCNCQVVL